MQRQTSSLRRLARFMLLWILVAIPTVALLVLLSSLVSADMGPWKLTAILLGGAIFLAWIFPKIFVKVMDILKI